MELEWRISYLKPCPYCKSKELKTSEYFGFELYYFVWCTNCGARGPKCLTGDNAVKEYNALQEIKSD